MSNIASKMYNLVQVRRNVVHFFTQRAPDLHKVVRFLYNVGIFLIHGGFSL